MALLFPLDPNTYTSRFFGEPRSVRALTSPGPQWQQTTKKSPAARLSTLLCQLVIEPWPSHRRRRRYVDLLVGRRWPTFRADHRPESISGSHGGIPAALWGIGALLRPGLLWCGLLILGTGEGVGWRPVCIVYAPRQLDRGWNVSLGISRYGAFL